jgi:hypothetical protein
MLPRLAVFAALIFLSPSAVRAQDLASAIVGVWKVVSIETKEVETTSGCSREVCLTETKLGGSNHTIGYGWSRAGSARLRFSEIEPPLGSATNSPRSRTVANALNLLTDMAGLATRSPL